MSRSRVLGIGILLVGVVALFSYASTQVACDGAFPVGEFRVVVRNQDGQPVEGAVLRVLHTDGREPAFGYPFRNYTADQPLLSDERGRIVAIQPRVGFHFGWVEWRLFWVIPMKTGGTPEYVCEVTAEGYKPAEFNVLQLFKAPPAEEDGSPGIKIDLGHGVEGRLPAQKFDLILIK